MKKMSKRNGMIALALVLALLVCGAALADNKLYTSPNFTIPADQVLTDAEPAQGDAGDGTETLPEGAEVPEGTEVPEGAELPEDTGLPADETEGEPQETEAPDQSEPLPEEERMVYITSSRGDYISEGEMIYLESHLVGFGDLQVAYQWQVDKNDGAGWQNVGDNRDYYIFMATKDSVQYNWRLIVDVIE